MAIRVEDPRSSLHHFKALMEDRKRGPGDLYVRTFNNINIAVLHAIGGERVESVNYSYHNEFV